MWHIGKFLDSWHLRKLKFGNWCDLGEPAATLTEANAVCSGDPGSDYQQPVLDLDIPCVMFTSTNGNSHLLIDKMLTKAQYDKLLTTLHEVGLYNDGCLTHWKKHGFTAVRLPWVIKENNDNS